MARYSHDPVLTTPLPSTRIPWLVILLLLAGLWFAHAFFFGRLGGPPPTIDYLPKMAPAVVAPVTPAAPRTVISTPTPPAVHVPRPAAPRAVRPAGRPATRPAARPALIPARRQPERRLPAEAPLASPDGRW